MKLLLLSVGKPHEAYIKEGVEDFTKRLAKYYPAEWQIIPPPKAAATMQVDEQKKQEGNSILQHIIKEDYLVVLDERGKMFSSIELAQFIQQRANESSKRVVFLIGGAFGISEAVRMRADFVWSLSNLVFPHMLVRLILAEQLYRACTIQRNEKYHHI